MVGVGVVEQVGQMTSGHVVAGGVVGHMVGVGVVGQVTSGQLVMVVVGGGQVVSGHKVEEVITGQVRLEAMLI